MADENKTPGLGLDMTDEQTPEVSKAAQSSVSEPQSATKKSKSSGKDTKKETDSKDEAKQPKPSEPAKRPVVIVKVTASCRWPQIQSAGRVFTQVPTEFARASLSEAVLAELKGNPNLEVVETEV